MGKLSVLCPSALFLDLEKKKEFRKSFLSQIPTMADSSLEIKLYAKFAANFYVIFLVRNYSFFLTFLNDTFSIFQINVLS